MKRPVRKILRALVVLVPLAYFLPWLVAFYAACGLYDVSRNRPFGLDVARRYFLGNGLFTFLLSPFNILLDLLALPYVNKGVYQLADLPPAYQAEVRRLIDTVHRQRLVEKLEAVAQDHKRSMFFFKWYGRNVQTVVDVPALQEDYRFIKTIGVSVFNRKASTSAHFGPTRATLRILYNINDMLGEAAHIVVGDVDHYWSKEKLFIFDDTLLHQSFNESDQVRYCIFADIARPSMIPAAIGAIVALINKIMSLGGSAAFYGNWKVFKA